MKRLFGFSNRTEAFPAPLISWVEEHGFIRGVFPTGESIFLTIDGRPATEIEVRLKDNFIESAGDITASSLYKLTAFAINAKEITVGTPQQVLRMLETECESDRHTPEVSELLKTARDSWRAEFIPQGC